MTLAILQTGEMPRLAQPTIVVVAVIYFAIVAAIGAWATRRTRTASDFFVAGEGIGLIALTLAAMSATLSGFAFIGGPGLVYRGGLGTMFLILPAAVTASMTSWVLAKRMRLRLVQPPQARGDVGDLFVRQAEAGGRDKPGLLA